MLSGGNPRKLERAAEVYELVMKNQAKFNELFECMFSNDEIVRLRASDTVEKIAREKPAWLIPYKQKLFNKMPKVRQPSVQWHLAQIFMEIELSEAETKQAIKILQDNIKTLPDWIVINFSIEALAYFTRKNLFEKPDLVKVLNQTSKDPHKSVAARSQKYLKEFR